MKRFLAGALLVFAAASSAYAATVKTLPDTKVEDRLTRADMLARGGYYPPSCEGKKTCVFTGPGGEVWVWEGYARAMLMQGKTLLFKGKCQSACYLAYQEAMRINPNKVRVAPGTVFYRHKPYLLPQ